MTSAGESSSTSMHTTGPTGRAPSTTTVAPANAAASLARSANRSSAMTTRAQRPLNATARSAAGIFVPSGAGIRPDSVAPTASAMASADSSTRHGTNEPRSKPSASSHAAAPPARRASSSPDKVKLAVTIAGRSEPTHWSRKSSFQVIRRARSGRRRRATSGRLRNPNRKTPETLPRARYHDLHRPFDATESPSPACPQCPAVAQRSPWPNR